MSNEREAEEGFMVELENGEMAEGSGAKRD
jgi:hypothetical protein